MSENSPQFDDIVAGMPDVQDAMQAASDDHNKLHYAAHLRDEALHDTIHTMASMQRNVDLLERRNETDKLGYRLSKEGVVRLSDRIKRFTNDFFDLHKSLFNAPPEPVCRECKQMWETAKCALGGCSKRGEE